MYLIQRIGGTFLVNFAKPVNPVKPSTTVDKSEDRWQSRPHIGERVFAAKKAEPPIRVVFSCHHTEGSMCTTTLRGGVVPHVDTTKHHCLSKVKNADS